MPAAEAHHVRDVLRLAVGDELELFDAAGGTAVGRIVAVTVGVVAVEVSAVTLAERVGVSLTVAAAVPKGDRADWMVEKLSELGVARFVPLAAARSVVLPGGRNKVERWERLAVESAKQCRRAGVMAIDPVTPVAAVHRRGRGVGAVDRGRRACRSGGRRCRRRSRCWSGPRAGGRTTSWRRAGRRGGSPSA